MTFHDRKPPRIVALGGPVTAAIRAVRDDLPDAERERVRTLRRAIADRIEADIALLDALAPDADDEPSLGAREPIDSAFSHRAPNGRVYSLSDQSHWAGGSSDDREEENEHGGDVQDEPHDAEPDDEEGPDDILSSRRDPSVDAEARAARRQLDAIRARRLGGAPGTLRIVSLAGLGVRA